MPPCINLQGKPKSLLKSTFMICCRQIFFLARVGSYNLPASLILTFISFLMTFNNSWRPSFADRVKGINYIKEALVLCWSLSSYQVCECRLVILGPRKLRKDHRHYSEDRSGKAVSFNHHKPESSECCSLRVHLFNKEWSAIQHRPRAPGNTDGPGEYSSIASKGIQEHLMEHHQCLVEQPG